MKVIIYPHIDPYYSSFYIYGLQQMFGNSNIRYSTKGFEDLPPDDIWNVYMAFIVEDEVGGRKKYVIDSNDYCTVKQKMYEWCDVYGHCNANFTKYSQEDYPKLIVLCPSFGVRCWNIIETLWYCITNIMKLHFHAVPSIKRLVGRYYKQFMRRPYENYTMTGSEVLDNYIFSLNTLWYNTGNENNDAGVNYRRTLFFDACRSFENITFEGGLVPTKRSSKQSGKFAKYLTKGVNSKEYLEKIKASVCVFNTPAFWSCHGWKLGEYMALGKCIITTPISNELPPPSAHLFCIAESTKDSMQKQIAYIISHPEFRKRKEDGLRQYWERNGTPIASLKRLGITVD